MGDPLVCGDGGHARCGRDPGLGHHIYRQLDGRCRGYYPEGTCDSDPAAAVVCTLREAIQEANFVSGADSIKFVIPGDGPHIIAPPSSERPDIEDPVTIDGYTQGDSTPGILTDDAQENTLAFGTNAVLKIVLSGADADPGSDGFDVEEGPTNIRGLAINGFLSNAGSGGQVIGFFNLAVITNNVVEGDFIGTSKNGFSDFGNIQDGVRMNGSKNVVMNNVVAFSGDAATNHIDNGVEVFKSGTTTPVGNRILSSSIFQNETLGIDLNDTIGPSPGDPEGREQDPKDPDTGLNNLQNFPVITVGASTGTRTTATGTLRSKPLKTFTVQLFSDLTDTEEGKTFLGQVKTNRRGKGLFSFFGTAVPQANAITATTTGADGTSEFSDPVAVVPVS